MRLRFVLAAAMVVAATGASAQRLERGGDRPPVGIRQAYQGGGGGGQSDRFSRKVRLGRDGRFSLSNISGDIVVTGGSGEDVDIEAVKRTRGDQRRLADVRIEVEDRAGRVDVRTIYPRDNQRGPGVSVTYTVTVPSSASVDLRSISGNVRVTNVQGAVRTDSISGNVTASGTPRLEVVHTISGEIDIIDGGSDSELAVNTISGNVRARGLKARSVDATTVSGDVHLIDANCERVGMRSTSGNAEYSGTLSRNGRYDFNSHSGDIRLTLSDAVGFDLTANTFSGTIRSDLPLTLGGAGNDRTTVGGRVEIRRGGPGRGTIQARSGDGSASILARTFSGDVVITRR
jgi:DUF4097 and DUF4098 domain-containing protein YvlB